jgi:hypothetical protein
LVLQNVQETRVQYLKCLKCGWMTAYDDSNHSKV